MPSVVAKSTDVARLDAVESVTVKVALPAPSSTVTSLIEKLGGESLSVMVPTPWLSLIVALTRFERVTLKVSRASSSV